MLNMILSDRKRYVVNDVLQNCAVHCGVVTAVRFTFIISKMKTGICTIQCNDAVHYIRHRSAIRCNDVVHYIRQLSAMRCNDVVHYIRYRSAAKSTAKKCSRAMCMFAFFLSQNFQLLF